MVKATLIRTLSDNQGTLGKLSVLDKSWYSLELPFADNVNNKSCIPTGDYLCKWTRSPRLSRKYGRPHYTYEILGVTGRAGIRIHGGNLAGASPLISHSLGCPLLGNKVGLINGQRAVFDSRNAVMNFERLLAGQPFMLEVKNA